MPSRVFLEASLALWERRHKYRQRRLDIAHQRNNKAGIAKWHVLLVAAGVMIRKRRGQLGVPGPLSTNRQRVVNAAKEAARNYRANPEAYHYLAGGTANEIIMKPTPRTFRSDCSQFAVNVYREAGVACPGTGSYLYSNTVTIAAAGKVTTNPKPGDLGMYGSRTAPHHVEVVVDTSPMTFVGHGSLPIDGLTPGMPSYYLTFPGLD